MSGMKNAANQSGYIAVPAHWVEVSVLSNAYLVERGAVGATHKTSTMPFDKQWVLSRLDVLGHNDIDFYFMVANLFEKRCVNIESIEAVCGGGANGCHI